ncbi:MAG TPA: glycosyltransferase [Mycobacteriales bacterium]
MRVLVVVPWEPWRLADGVVLPLHHHLHALAGRHQLTVLASGSRVRGELQVTGPERTLPDGVRCRAFGTKRPPALDYLLRRGRSALRREPAHVFYVERPALLAALADEVPRHDVLHLVGWGTAQLATRYADVPSVHVAVDPWEPSWNNRRYGPVRRLADAGQRSQVARHEARHYPHATAVVVVAEADADLLRQRIPTARFAVVPNGVVPGPEPTPLPATDVLGFHGAFETQANVDGARALVERVWPRVRERLPGCTVLLAGRDPSREVLDLAAQPGVELRADVPDMRGELDRMAVHVAWMPSGLGQKNKVLEAMAAGRPVVANARGASGIGAGDGLLVAEDDAAAADLVVALLADRARAEQVGRAGRDRVVREFGWAASAQRMERLWEQAVAGEATP